MATNISDGVLTFDFTETDWRTKFPDIYNVTDSNGFYTDSTFQYNGIDTLRSYGISHSGTSQTTITFTLLQAGVLSLNYTVSSESNYDWLWIDIDGTNVVKKSGVVDWTDFTKELTAGEHTLVVKYTKDGSQSKNNDAGAIGYLTISGVTPPYDKRYLIQSGATLYTVVDGALSELAEAELTAQTFLDYGVENIPDGALIVGLSNPDVLYWQDSTDDLPLLTATVTGVPFPQTVISEKIDLTDSTIKGIESALATCEGDLIVAVSFDDKATWKAHNGTEWVTLSDDSTGMSKETLEAITFEQWNELYTGATGFYVRIALTDSAQSVEKIVFDFAN